MAVVSMGPVLSRPAAAATPADNLFTTYSLIGHNQISWVTCGSTAYTSGCYDSGTLGNLNNACDIMEGPPTYVSSTPSQYFVARHVFVMNAGTTAAGTMLNVYRKTDTITNTFDTTTITLVKQVALPLTGGNVKCFMAGNAVALFMGTDQSPNAVEVTIAGKVVTPIPGFSLPINVSQISASDGGFVTVTFGSGAETGFIVFGPDGGLEEDGGGSPFVINNLQGIQLMPSAPMAAHALTVAHQHFHVCRQ
ncbi:MAG: hypothetical protein ACREDM_01605 [Methylocella sp.]